MVLPSAALSASLCWQLPTYDGTKSYQNLLVGVYGMVSYGLINYGKYDKADSQIQSTPLDLIRSGTYSYTSGYINNRSDEGHYWQPIVYSEFNVRYLSFYVTLLYPQDGGWYHKGYGMPLRCLVR